jgi:hypothetical protein
MCPQEFDVMRLGAELPGGVGVGEAEPHPLVEADPACRHRVVGPVLLRARRGMPGSFSSVHVPCVPLMAPCAGSMA